MTSLTDGSWYGTSSYAYEASGLRSTTTTAAGTQRYVWNTLAAVPTLLSDTDRLYVYGVGSTPLAQIDRATGEVVYLHADLIGSVRTVTDTSGTIIVADADYTPYGTPVDVTADPVSAITPFGYAGQYTDPTGNLYLRARYYDPATAQFLTRDPLEALTANPYGYTDGNPLQYIDPLGLSWWNPASWSADDLDFASTVLSGAALVLSITGVGAPVAAGLEALSVAASVGAAYKHASEGDALGAVASAVGALPGLGAIGGKVASMTARYVARETIAEAATRAAVVKPGSVGRAITYWSGAAGDFEWGLTYPSSVLSCAGVI
jgi:RHS repeat-associated protein